MSRSSGVEPAEAPVEGAELLAWPRAADDDTAVRELRPVERVQRAAPDVHDVVRHVDDVRDRAHVGEEETRAEPLRRRADRDVAEDAADVARAAVEVVDRDVDDLRVHDGRVLRRGQVQLAAEQRRHLARDTGHREQVDAVDGRSDVEHHVSDREHVDERRPGLRPVGEHHDPRVVVAETDLVLGEDHPARGLAAELALVQRQVEDREVGTRQRDRDRRSRLEVPGAAHDLARVPFPDIHLADPEAIGVRVRADLEDAADEEPAEVAVHVRHADVEHALDLGRRREEPVGDLARGRVHGDVLAQPAERDVHR